jgi:hypothetical protein
MKTWLKQASWLGAITATLCMNVFADNSQAQLDTTPPPPEAALTADQTPPISSSGGSVDTGGSTSAAPAK